METLLPQTDDLDRRSCYLNGLLRLRAGQPEEASGLLMQALLDRPDDTDIRRNLVRALLAAERYADVLDQAAIGLAFEPADAEMHFAQGTALSALHRPAAARAALTRSIVLDPGLAAGWLNLGNVCVDLDDRTEAERHYRTAIRLDPMLAAARTSLGHLLTTQGRLDEAKAECEALYRAWAAENAERRVVALRPGIVYGADSPFWIRKMGERILAGGWGLFGPRGEGKAALIHNDDLARLVAVVLPQHLPATLRGSVEALEKAAAAAARNAGSPGRLAFSRS